MSPQSTPRDNTSHLAAGPPAATTLVPLVVAVAAVGGLAVLAPAQAWALMVRLAPVLLFVAAMSVVVNLASAAGAFEAVARWARRQQPSWLSTRATAWCQIVVLSLVSTVFLSLDTTAILVTPLAVALARRGGLSLWAAALTVIWIANIGSLLLPVSNLTNLLAVGSGVFTGPGAYVGASWRPAIAGIGVAVAASWVAFRWSARGRSHSEDGVGGGAGAAELEGGAGAAELEPTAEATGSRRLRATLVTLAVLLPLLATPFPYWISATVAAAIMLAVNLRSGQPHPGETTTTTTPPAPRPPLRLLIPWSSLVFVTALSAAAAIAHHAGALDVLGRAVASRQDSVGGLLAIAGLGASSSNLINNIPAFLALEHGADTPHGMLALLVGVNAGPIIAPWASLATLLWHDQLRRAGAVVSWGSFIAAGCVLAPIAVALPVLAIG
ncbi:SLC13 family permease [Dietzia aurantiaca]|uniref:SLC13 family permease n=1 Tax=Dietzia aurantiaca TaxID=983873 RepID=A0ABV9PP19_9ACTN